MNSLRTASGREIRSAALHEHPLPIAYDPTILPGARVLAEDGQIYESIKNADTGLYEWKQRAQGEPGPAIEIQKTSTEIQWRVAGADNPWTTIITLNEIVGPAGETGPPGAGLSFQGSVPTAADLPETSTTGFAYLVEDTEDIWAFDGAIWVNTGPAVQGPPGDKGDPGEPGSAGAAVELRKTLTDLEWRLAGEATWRVLVSLDDIRGPVGDDGPDGPAGPGFSFQGKVPTLDDLPLPALSTQGFGYEIEATGDLHIFNGIAWVNAGPLRGPKGDKGDPGEGGPPGLGFSYQGAVATVGDLPDPSIQGHAYRVGTDLWIYNGAEWVNAGSLQGPKGDPGDLGPQGPAGSGFAFQGSVPTTADLPLETSNGHAYKVEDAGDLYIYNGQAWVNAGPLQGPQGEQGPPGVGEQGDPGPAGPGLPAGGAQHQLIRKSITEEDYATEWFTLDAQAIGLGASDAPEFTGLGLGTPAAPGWKMTVGGGICQLRSSVTASSGTYTLNVQAGNEFVTAAAISGPTTINLSNLDAIPAGYTWRGVLSFAYSSGAISWFTGNSGYAIKWDGRIAPTPTANEVESVVITVTGTGGNGGTIEVAALQGRTWP